MTTTARTLNPRPELVDLVHELRDRGLRATTGRLILLRALKALDHPTIENLHRATAASGIAPATVYRTIDTLERAGIVWALHVPRTGLVYHAAATNSHAHLTCRSCGTLHDLPQVSVGVTPATCDDQGFSLDLIHVTAIGLCPACSPGHHPRSTDTNEPVAADRS